tara:strand:+ start:196 stop:366 length:171 start_codon:yes stop_codon:yes gene_type:complete
MDVYDYINAYKTMELSEAIQACEEHACTFEEYRVDYPSSGLNGWVGTKQLFGWLGY